MIINNKNEIKNNNIILVAIFTSIRYITREQMLVEKKVWGQFLRLFIRKKLNPQLNVVTNDIKKIHLLSLQIKNEILELFAQVLLRDIIKQIVWLLQYNMRHRIFQLIKVLNLT